MLLDYMLRASYLRPEDLGAAEVGGRCRKGGREY